ncbi:MAG: NAD-dependent deacylase [Planctomycetes bacterium]|nr:NAD-dependent deacylase [Planctomycetota bacterium]
MIVINPFDYQNIVFFTGAGMSAESGIPTFRGEGGIWDTYDWGEYACQSAFDRNPMKVLEFHEMGRKLFLECKPHAGHFVIAGLEREHQNVVVITQNIDGMHQRAGSKNVIELHGSLWRVRCPHHGVFEEISEKYLRHQCDRCGSWLRPDITWFGDLLDQNIINEATEVIERCNLFISVGTSGLVWPAAGFPETAKHNNAMCIEINPGETEMSYLYHETIRDKAGNVLPKLFQRGKK